MSGNRYAEQLKADAVKQVAEPRPQRRKMTLADHAIFLVTNIAVIAPRLAEIPVVSRVP